MGLDMYLFSVQKPFDETQLDLSQADVVFTELGYWRKANAIHRYFTSDGWLVDDRFDPSYRDAERKRFQKERAMILQKEVLEDLLERCKTVLEKSVLVEGQVQNGYSFDHDGNKKYFYEDGQLVANSEVADAILPTQDGFFFGSTCYDEWYINDIKETILILENVLRDFDFSKYQIVYAASW